MAIETPSTREGQQPNTPEAVAAAPRSRRSLLVGAAAAAAGALVAQAVGHPATADAAGVVLGHSNTASSTTTIKNNRASASAKAISGQTTFTGTAASSAGVRGESKGQDGRGVLGVANSGSNALGVSGVAASGTGVLGTGGATGVQGTGGATGVRGTGGPTGVLGSGSTYGVYGSGSSYGVYGTSSAYGVYGSGSYGVVGSGSSVGTYGAGSTYGAYGTGPSGVVGTSSSSGYGVWGYNSSNSGYGVYGQNTGSNGTGVLGQGALRGVLASSPYVGLWGTATATSGTNYGVYGATSSAAGYGVTGQATGSGYAGVFFGNVYVSGSVAKSGGSFMIDHPLEPDRRYLIHSFVEAPERLNVYSGTVKLDGRGRATVRLPRYFDAANKDFRYQLTPIGKAAPNLHVGNGVEHNRFSIAGGAPGQTVSWQVTGVRQDAWAKANPMRVEPLKRKADRGSYLQPELFGRPRSAAIHKRLPTRAARVLKHPKVLHVQHPKELRVPSAHKAG